MASPLNDPKLEALLDTLHVESKLQMDETIAYFKKREREIAIDQAGFYDKDMCRFLSNKMVAIVGDCSYHAVIYINAY